VCVVLAVVVVLCILLGALCVTVVLRYTRSADEQLADIEEARAVPDAENAAILYDELLRDPKATSLLSRCPDFLVGPVFNQRRTEPWHSQDHPELAAWIGEHQYIIDKLVEASQFEQCRFPIDIDITSINPMGRGVMRQWAFLLIFAVNNDLAEGRPDAGMAKWRCLLGMTDHLRQQPDLIDNLLAEAVARLALESMARFVVTGDVSAEHLRKLEAMPLHLADDWEQHADEIRRIERLMMQKLDERFGLWDRAKSRVFSFRTKRMMREMMGEDGESPIERAAVLYRQNLASACGLRLLIELRRAKNRTGLWPQSLDEIASTVPASVLIDPQNNGPFVYYRVNEGFRLYSAGPNGTDEYGRHGDNGRDDWPIWPPR
jgi:hypothetical protein